MIVKDLSSSFNPYPKNQKPKEPQKRIKQKSNKLRKLEKQRDKGRTKEGKCEYCHKHSKRLDPHEVYGGANRQRSIKYGFVAMLCRECHQNYGVLAELKIKYQKEYEKEHSRSEFLKIIGKNFIEEENKNGSSTED